MSSPTALRVKELLREKGWSTKTLAEKTGMSESYLTHIKNGTRRWNEDSLRKLAKAFEMSPIDLFVQRRQRTDVIENQVSLPLESSEVEVKVQVIPIMGDIPAQPCPFNNQITQVTTGFKDSFLPFFNYNDPAMFALQITSNHLAPTFEKGDLLVISPEMWTNSGDIAAVEYGSDVVTRSIMRVTMTEDFVVLESVNYKQQPIALVRGKDHFRILGRVIARHQKFA